MSYASVLVEKAKGILKGAPGANEHVDNTTATFASEGSPDLLSALALLISQLSYDPGSSDSLEGRLDQDYPPYITEPVPVDPDEDDLDPDDALTDLPADEILEGDDRLQPNEAAEVALRALWRWYMSTHYPPKDGDGDFDYANQDGYGPQEGDRAHLEEFEAEKSDPELILKSFDLAKVGGPPGTNQYGPPGTHTTTAPAPVPATSGTKVGDHVVVNGKMMTVTGVKPDGSVKVSGHPAVGKTPAGSGHKTVAPGKVKAHAAGNGAKAHAHKGVGTHAHPSTRHKQDVVFWKSEEQQQIVYGVVLIPELPDSQGDVISADEIEAAAHKFLTHYRESGIQHVGDALPSLEVIESYIAPVDLEVAGKPVPQGAWVMAVRINDPEIWQMVLDGTLTGFSIQGWANSEPEEEAA